MVKPEIPEHGHKKEYTKDEIYDFGMKNYAQFNVKALGFKEMLREHDRIMQSNEVVANRVNDASENRERIINFLNGQSNSELGNILNRQNFDLDNLKADDLENNILQINKIIIKNESYFEAVKKQEKTCMKIIGFEKDPDFKGIGSILKKVFSEDLLNKCIVSEITYEFEVVHMRLNGMDKTFFLSVPAYNDWKKSMPIIKKYRSRATNFGSWNTDHNLSYQYIPMPIHFYAFIDDEVDKIDYLQSVAKAEQLRLYKIGTLVHEFSHNIYYYLMDGNLRKDWQKIIESHKSAITAYAEKHRIGIHGEKVDYNEEFAESIRLFVTMPAYLKAKFPDVYKFIKDKFPDINSL